jgi:hypothetical protein
MTATKLRAAALALAAAVYICFPAPTWCSDQQSISAGNSKASQKGCQKTEDESAPLTKPTCYSSPLSRHSALQGGWQHLSTAQSPYWNLSCPIEWSKYSCVHQDAARHASQARKLHFEPTDCTLPPIGNQQLPTGQRVVFFGDSLIRQVFISMACLLSNHVVKTELHWPECGGKQPEEWPCHEAPNCIACGPHSGFRKAIIHLSGGSQLEYRSSLPEMGPKDVLIMETGVHGNDPQAMTLARIAKIRHLLDQNSTIIWFVTPQDAFKSSAGDGMYNVEFLTKTGAPIGFPCENIVLPVRSQGEWRALNQSKRVLSQLFGVIELANLHEQGHAKVGGRKGGFGDCQHYCMPGVPDLFARAVFAMLQAVGKSYDA